MNCARLIFAFVCVATATLAQPAADDPFLVSRYDALNDSPQQAKFRRLHPWPAGVVFIEHVGMTPEDMRRQFRLMRELGFSCLKQVGLRPGTDWRAVARLALDEGVVPWWYDDAGGEDPTPERLAALGIPATLAIAQVRVHPVWQQRQRELFVARIERGEARKAAPFAHQSDGLPGTISRAEYGLPPESAGPFVAWLQQRYGTVAALRRSWNFDEALGRGRRDWESWSQVEAEVVSLVTKEKQEYRRMADVFRFRADAHLAKIEASRDLALAADPNEPLRSGGEMSLFLPFAARSTDMEGVASAMRTGGSFYPSMHPGWHFEEVDFEYLRPIYLQASLAVDWFKGGWAAPWEASGGPQQLSGGKAPFIEEVRDQVAGFTIDENTIQQLMLSWIAAGMKGFGLWCWNGRTFGWEGGEYALLDRNQNVSARAVAAGRIAAASRRLRDELWTAHKEPLVGVFQDFESDSFYAALAVGGRDMYKQWPMRARVGVGRALIDANIPWEHVTARNVRAGLADRYRCIYLPAQLALDPELLELLRAYVERGGRVIMDAPGGWYGYDGKLLPTGEGTAFERLFGCRIADFYYSRANHTQWSIAGQALAGFVLDLQPTRARTVQTFHNGRPAVVEHRLGKGTAVILGFEASLGCWRPGARWLENEIATLARNQRPVPYQCAEAVVYRLAAPTADHYFLMNDGPDPIEATLSTAATPRRIEDPITGEPVEARAKVAIPAYGARWLRFVK